MSALLRAGNDDMDNTLFFTARLNYIIQWLHATYFYATGYAEFSVLGAYKECPLNDVSEKELKSLFDLMIVFGLLREGTEKGYYTFCFEK